MKVLGIDTSNLVLSVAVVDDKQVLGEYTTNLKKNHSIRLMPAISMLLDELGLAPEELNGIAIAHGPGSYTGVRIGLTTAKSLAWALDIPIIGISSLEAIASNSTYFPGMVSPLVDARRGQVYTACFKNGERMADDRIRLIADWAAELKEANQAVLFLGDDSALHKEVITEALGDLAQFGPVEWNVPRAAFIARVGLQKLEKGEHVDLDTFVPEYLQLAEAESKWLASQKK
ncbi:MAG TPA: tRNA (adenosine(37)-N6)-threonylcarbamoyltransferase complex dimerization subunit type 1 TsaB [Bacillota bacterium]|nr:tRNA (adenosine(37)-N6)-threonylcarbamoyltransferase complex dimerization subunit type 1 TsaB [Bacillota bacterium]